MKDPRSYIKGFNTKLAKSEKCDCVVRAFATAFDVRYNKAHKFVKETYNRKNKIGVCTNDYYKINNSFFNNKVKIFDKTIIEIGDEISEGVFSPRTHRGSKISKMTVGTFMNNNKKGTFIISLYNHSFTIRDGIVVGGNRNDITRKRAIINRVWEIK